MKTSRFKAGLAGTSCAGKTTLAYSIVGRLKSYGVLAEGVFSQDRKFSFDKSLLETHEVAQNWMITNMIAKEIEMSLHGDVDLLISDRTALDFFAYYRYQYPNSLLASACWQYVKEWCTTYDVIYLLDPLPYQADGKRPNDEFRTAVHEVLLQLAHEVPNVVRIERHNILNDVMIRAGIEKPNVKNILTEDDVKALATSLGQPVVFKQGTKTPDALTDNDLYIVVSDPLDTDLRDKLRTFVRGLFGPFCQIDLHLTNTTATFDSRFKTYLPAASES